MAYYNQPYMQPYNQGYQQMYPQTLQQTQQQNNNGVIWVCGEAGAKAWAVAQGQSVMLMDSENPVLYLKSADMSGIPSMRIFDLVERNTKPAQPAMQIDTSQFVTRKEFEELRSALTNKKEVKRNAEPAV